MTEKSDLDSMATVQMKPEYAPSEVYSTASEPPPAYKRKSSSVQIAKICAFTVIVSSFIIGAFILASAYLQAKASCDQMQALDSVLEKELMLETLQQDLPRADALIGKETDENDLQNLDSDDTKTNKIKPEASSTTSDSKFSDESDEAEDLQKIHMKVPLELGLSDLAASLLQNNQKSRMNCVVERKRAEEFVDSPSKTVNLPFGVNLTTDPKKAKITGERIAIFCESGSESGERKNNNEDLDAEQIHPMFIPIQRLPIPFGAIPQQNPLTHMPQRMMPPPPPPQQQQPPMIHQIPPPFQHLPMSRPPMTPPQMMRAPMRDASDEEIIRQAFGPQVRIQVQRIPIREIRLPQSFQQLPFPFRAFDSSKSSESSQQNSNEFPQIQVQRVPLGEALQRAGITPDDLRNIQRMAEERISDELHRLAAEEAASNSAESEEEEDPTSSVQQQSSEQTSKPTMSMEQHGDDFTKIPDENMKPPMPDQPQILQIGRAAFGRSLPQPVRIPVPMMQAQADLNSQETQESERPHYVHPRSIRA